MKQPRTSDFDPTATERELKSSMTDFPVIEQPNQLQPAGRLPENIPPGLPGLPGRPVLEEPSTIPSKRKIKSRHGYDVFEDQVEEIRQLALEDRMRGGMGSQSAIVREALDDYLAKIRA